MNVSIRYLLNAASEAEVIEHLHACDADFIPPLASRVEISTYAKKILSNATRFEAWSEGALVGLVAAYCNDQKTRIVYITSVSVLRERASNGIASRLISQCIEHAKALDMWLVSLEVAQDNAAAIRLYERSGFAAPDMNTPVISMNLYLKKRNEHEYPA